MSGRRQHFLPRFLQRQFRSRRKGDEEYVHVFRRQRAYEANLMGVGQERDFYGNPNGSALDAAITAGESNLASIVAALNADHPEEVSTKLTAMLVSAVSIRTKAMREALAGLLPTMLVALRQELANDVRLRGELRAQLSSEWLDAQIAKHIQEANVGRNERAKLKSTLKAKIRAEVIRNETMLLGNMKAEAAKVLDALDEKAATVADGAYLKALSADPHTPKRAERFEDFHFFVVRSSGQEFFILGDCGVTAAFSDGKNRLALGSIDDDVDLETLMLPISPTRCLIGSRDKDSARPSVRTINEVSAKLSYEFFISDRDHADLASFQRLINTEEPIETTESVIAALVGSQ